MKLSLCKFLMNASQYEIFISHSLSLRFLLTCNTILLFLSSLASFFLITLCNCHHIIVPGILTMHSLMMVG